jgi:uncharacterized protein (DUF2141 family)
MCAAPSHKQIELHCIHFRNNTGHARIAVYNNPNTFCNESIKPFKEVSGEIINKECMISIGDLPDGEYALTLLHDENEDSVMNYNFLGLPKEGYGFSNNVLPGFSKPGFNACKIKVVSGSIVSQTIKVRYLF